MGKLIFAMSQSLDGYVAAVDGTLHGPPDLALFRHFIDLETSLAGDLYGRRMYEVMRYWDEDQPEWDAHEHDFARVWRAASEMGRDTLAEVGRPERHAR